MHGKLWEILWGQKWLRNIRWLTEGRTCTLWRRLTGVYKCAYTHTCWHNYTIRRSCLCSCNKDYFSSVKTNTWLHVNVISWQGDMMCAAVSVRTKRFPFSQIRVPHFPLLKRHRERETHTHTERAGSYVKRHMSDHHVSCTAHSAPCGFFCSHILDVLRTASF